MTLNKVLVNAMAFVLLGASTLLADDTKQENPVIPPEEEMAIAPESSNQVGSNIPEPAAALLALIGFAWLFRRR